MTSMRGLIICAFLFLLVGFVIGYFPNAARIQRRTQCIRSIPFSSNQLGISLPHGLASDKTLVSAARIGFETERRAAESLTYDISLCDAAGKFETLKAEVVEARLTQLILPVEERFRGR